MSPHALAAVLALALLPVAGCASQAQRAGSDEPVVSGARAPLPPPPSRSELEQALAAGPVAGAAPLGPEALAPLTELVNDRAESTERRTRAVQAIGAIDSPQSTSALAVWAKDERAELAIRSEAARVLGQKGGPAALPELTPLLADAHPELRAAAARALGTLGSEAAREPLEDRLTQEEDPAIREALQQSLTLLQP